MRTLRTLLVSSFALLLAGSIAAAEVKVTVERNEGDKATPDFKFKDVPTPAKTSAATNAKYTIVDGDKDGASGDLDVLHDGKLPTEEDQPDANFFFNAGTEGGRLGIDLGSVTDIKQVNTYSWHKDTRAAQVYTLYAADGTAAGFNSAPKNDVDPEKCGWTLVTKVDTRPKTGDTGGQYGVSIADSTATLGKYRYLLLVVSRTESDDDFGNTFFSEITVIDDKAAGDQHPATPPAAAEAPKLDILPAKAATR